MKLSPKIKEQIKAIAIANPNIEVCGVVLKNQEVLQLRNVSRSPKEHFKLDLEEWESFKGRIKAIFHLHWSDEHSGYLSPGDVENSRFFKIPYILYHTGFDSWDYFDPKGIHPYPLGITFDKTNLAHYLDWRFDYGRSDCGGFLRAIYAGILGIPLKDFARVNPEQMDGAKTFQIILEKAGFADVTESVREDGFKLYDVPLMSLDCPGRGQHVGIVWNLNPMRLLHHPGGDRLSEDVPYEGCWQRRTLLVFRHKSLGGVV